MRLNLGKPRAGIFTSVWRALQNHATRLHRLYEQQKAAAPEGAARLDEYVTRRRRWCQAELRRLDRSGLPPPGSFASKTETG